MSKIPNKKYEIVGKAWTTEALIIAALMRRLGIQEIEIAKLDMREPKGMIISDKIVLQEKGDVGV